MNNSGKPLDVLIITDNRKFNREAFFAMFDSFNNIRRTEKKHPQAIDFIGSDSIKTYDAVVFYYIPENVVLTQNRSRILSGFSNPEHRLFFCIIPFYPIVNGICFPKSSVGDIMEKHPKMFGTHFLNRKIIKNGQLFFVLTPTSQAN